MWAAPRDDDRRLLFAALMAALIALAWLALWVWGQSPYGRFLSHHGLEAVRGNAALMLVFVAGWTLMVVAMMLPTSLPLVALFRTLVRGRPDRARLTALLVAGYLAVWTLFGVLVYCGDFVLHGAVERSAWLGANVVPFIGAGTLLVAGLYQFTPLKYHCLQKCRSPLSFVTEHWRGSRESSRSFLLGAHHGLFCVGCCWSLMLVMFAVGLGSLGWMLVLGAVMAVEKNVSWGRKIGAPLGAVLLWWGLALGAVAVLATSQHTPLH
jgi:predicted metal-binding membrane protein